MNVTNIMSTMKPILKTVVILSAVLAVSSCVSSKKYTQLNAELMRVDGERSRALVQIDQLNELNANLKDQLRDLQQEQNDLSAKYSKLQADYKRLLEQNSAEASRMLLELQNTQQKLEDREKHVAELEQMLRNREMALNAIRQKVADALLGFEGKGLTITQRDGKVYVSMDDKLLFRSGSFEIDPQGAKAVKELANVLAQNPDINVMVEGHTDNVPYKGAGQLKDNWDLSVKRATTVVRLLLTDGNIDAGRITAAGRGEFFPLDREDNSLARQKNRRTEIILTPKLDELLQIMEQK